jgi:hypothetical protein
MDSYDNVILAVRDPVDHLVTCFNFHHPLGEYDGKSTFLFYECCFPNMTLYADAIFDKNPCGESARSPINHMAFGYCFQAG